MDVRMVALDEYPKGAGHWNVAQVRRGAERLADCLPRICGVAPVDVTDRATTSELRPWLDALSEEAEGSLVLYWAGHGEELGGRYVVALQDSSPPLRALNALGARELSDFIVAWGQRPPVDDEPRWLIVVLDTCKSVFGAREVWSLLDDEPDNVAVVATSSKEGNALAGRFPTLLEEQLDRYGQNDDHVKAGELVRRLEERLDEEADGIHVRGHIREGIWPRTQQPAALVGTRSDMEELRRALEDVPDVIRNHYYAKASAVGLNQLDWQFTGREDERGALASWLSDGPDNGLYAVTGLAGAGKSALLGMVLAATSAPLVDALTRLGVAFPDDTIPRRSFTTTLHLSNRTMAETIADIASQQGFSDVATPDDLVTAVANSADQVLILADALDESRDPLPVARLLHRLATQPGVCVVVGTRRSLTETPDNPAPANADLIDALNPDETLSLSTSSAAYAEYVQRRLDTAFPDLPPDRSRAIVEAITGRAETFLFVRLAVEELCADHTWVSPDADLDALLAHGHTGIFDLAVTRLRADNPTTEQLLHALAYARGNGFPRTGGVWEAAGSAIAGTRLRDPDVQRALDTAAAYIIQDAEFGDEVYRLGHRTYVEYYQGRDTR